jgi:hypothetical protein
MTARLACACLGLVLLPSMTQAQAPAVGSRHTLFAELLGSAGLYSINYEHRFAPRVGGRIGYGRWDADPLLGGDTRRIWTMPVTASYLPPTGRSGLELGGGLVIGSNHHIDDQGNTWAEGQTRALTGIAGYRVQSRRFMLRAAFTPILSLVSGDYVYPDDGLTPSVGLAAGITF